MTIDEAIAQEKEMAEMHRNDIVSKERYHNMPWIDKNNEASMRSAEKHEQLAEWLEELKVYQQHEIICNKGYNAGYNKGYNAGYNKAIDDFVKLVHKHDWNIRNINENSFIYGAIDTLAEQLKAGGENEQSI